MEVGAVVLAGNNPYKTQRLGVTAEALLPIGGRPMVDWVVRALQKTEAVRRLVIVGPPELAEYYRDKEAVILVPAGSNVIESARRGLTSLGNFPWVLFATADIPLLTPAAIMDFLRRCALREADFYYPIIRREDGERKYPGVKRTYVRVRDGTFTGGNLLLIRQELFDVCAARSEKLIRARKSPLALGRQIGFTFILRFLLHLVTVAEAESRISRLLGARGAGVICPYPEIGIDVDKEADLELVRRVLVPEEEKPGGCSSGNPGGRQG
ncbi:MAG: hypothetical protein PWP65_50 [Clostridia bacterium]|nr:hypothetical protein [Clostridia bacterium]